MIAQLEAIVREAGAEIMRIYAGDKDVTFKVDESPLTAADLAAHTIITTKLKALTPDIPVVSEEDYEAGLAQISSATKRFWLVDPLDGTKEFVKGTGEFTVNIALIENGYPIIGVVFAPAMDLLYIGEIKQGAWKREADGPLKPIAVCIVQLDQPVFVVSKDHAGPLVAALMKRYPHASSRSMGSSLKFCLVAEGQADVYLRDLPTMEWDTAAAQCVVEAAGGRVQTLEGKRFSYGKPDLRNPGFAALSAGAHELVAEIGKDSPKSNV